MLKKNKAIILVLTSVGIANIGEWIYFIALNLMILNRGGTAFSVGILYLLRPAATILTNVCFHGVVDKLNKKRWLIYLDIFRGGLISLLLVNENLTWVYVLVFVIQGAGALYEPIALSYTTLAIPERKRKKFNAWTSLVSSGGFLVGPAIAGILLTLGTPKLAVLVNIIALFFSASLTGCLPNYKLAHSEDAKTTSFVSEYQTGLKDIGYFAKENRLEVMLYGLVSSLFIFAASLDSVEAVFAKEILLLSDGKYGWLVSIAGAGFVIGSILNSLIIDKLEVKHLLVLGSILYTIGYLLFSLATTFLIAGAGCFLLSFALAYIHTGFKTFIQLKFPIAKLGQITATFGIVESLAEVILVAIISSMATVIPLRMVLVGTELVMCLVVFLLMRVLKRISV
ncbi:MFS transporter [Carnobacterium gallinarum]|uniref:MFS transporter n=1 Tax=Carnobacterium gallinarum TaxID=2749 RepID=UPI000558EFFC|nr:MFS transporter [Carnobacterium gallinarum]